MYKVKMGLSLCNKQVARPNDFSASFLRRYQFRNVNVIYDHVFINITQACGLQRHLSSK